MLLQNGISTERVALILKRYERRLENNKKWAKDYYVRHADDIKQKKLLAGVARGRCPSKTTIERLEVDRRLLIDAWVPYYLLIHVLRVTDKGLKNEHYRCDHVAVRRLRPGLG